MTNWVWSQGHSMVQLQHSAKGKIASPGDLCKHHTRLEAKLECGFPVRRPFLLAKIACVSVSEKRGQLGQPREYKAKVVITANRVCLVGRKVQGWQGSEASLSTENMGPFSSYRRQSRAPGCQSDHCFQMCFSPTPQNGNELRSLPRKFSTDSSLKRSKQLAEWLQWVGPLVNRLNIIPLLHTLNGTLSLEWNGIL